MANGVVDGGIKHQHHRNGRTGNSSFRLFPMTIFDDPSSSCEFLRQIRRHGQYFVAITFNTQIECAAASATWVLRETKIT